MSNRVVPTAAAEDPDGADFVIEEKQRPFEKEIDQILNNPAWTTVITMLTVFALFGDDVRIAFCPPDADPIFFGISILALVLFTFELIISCIGKPNYMLERKGICGHIGFYFVLDLVSTISLIPDTGLMNLSGDGGGSDNEALKAGRASKASKATRVIRLVRLVRMVRIVKLYKMQNADNEVVEDDTVDDIEPTVVGKKLNEQTTRKLIVMILATVVILPWLSVEGVLNVAVDDIYFRHGLSNLYNAFNLSQHYPETYPLIFAEALTNSYIDNLDSSLLYLNICSNENTTNENGGFNEDVCQEYFPNENYDSLDTIKTMLRGHLDPDQADKNLVEYQPIVPNSIDCDIDKPRKCPAYAIMLVDMKLKSTLNILKTLLVMFILVSGTMYFARDAKELVLDPIERMVNVVNRLSDNPLANTEDMMSGASNKDSKKGDDHKYETQLLEQTIVKIGQMLQIGFGAAGASIIGKNMKAGALNPMVPGKMITSIYGFCDIRNFTDTTECLQEEVMVYVNKIGFIVHGCTNDYYGMANKNVGDAFLLSWKICDDLLPGFNAFEDKPDEDARFKAMEAVSVLCKGTGSIERRITPTELADSALVAFLKCLVDMDNANTSGTLSMYLVNKKVVKRFGANFRIKMGFGMHVGWAIEGAIGSSYKIDATYMSPHVEMTDRLEAGSKIFGVPINISHWLYALLSPKARKYLRPMDKILVEGCPTPMTVYTFDVVHYPKTFGVAKLAEDGKTQLAVDFGADPQFNVLQQGLHPAFLDNARKGVEAYLAGQWPEARVIMEMALTQKPKDGPLLRTLGIMSEHNFIAPKNWPGYFEMLEGY